MSKDDKNQKKEDKKKGRLGGDHHDAVVDLAARIGARRPAPEPPAAEPPPPPPREEPPAPPPTRLDAPIPSQPRPLIPTRGERDQRDLMQRAEEEERTPSIPSQRTPPGPGEIDLVATPLPTPDDWHKFELALRRVRGVGQLRTEYYRHGVLKVRVSYQGTDRLATLLRAGVPGYRVRVIGEDRNTLQVLVASDGEERRPG
jgi:hypothetical protein